MNNKNNNNNDNDNVIIGGDYLINIFNKSSINSKSKRFGYNMDILEIEYDPDDNTITTINCILCKTFGEGHYDAPDYSKLIELETAKLTTNSSNTNDTFMIFFNHDNLDIIMARPNRITYYYKNGRVIYYYNDLKEICDIRVCNLTNTEYDILSKEEFDVGNYMKENNAKTK